MRNLNEKDWKNIEQWQKDATNIKSDLVDAQKAMVPNVELLLQRCDNCIERLNALKSTKPKKK